MDPGLRSTGLRETDNTRDPRLERTEGGTCTKIDGAGSRRGRIDGLTVFGADSVFVDADTAIALDTSVAGEVTATPTTGMQQSPAGEAERYAVTALWSDVNSIEFEWFFDWTANGTRGVHFNGNAAAFVPTPGSVGLLAGAGLLAVRRRR